MILRIVGWPKWIKELIETNIETCLAHLLQFMMSIKKYNQGNAAKSLFYVHNLI